MKTILAIIAISASSVALAGPVPDGTYQPVSITCQSGAPANTETQSYQLLSVSTTSFSDSNISMALDVARVGAPAGCVITVAGQYSLVGSKFVTTNIKGTATAQCGNPDLSNVSGGEAELFLAANQITLVTSSSGICSQADKEVIAMKKVR